MKWYEKRMDDIVAAGARCTSELLDRLEKLVADMLGREGRSEVEDFDQRSMKKYGVNCPWVTAYRLMYRYGFTAARIKGGFEVIGELEHFMTIHRIGKAFRKQAETVLNKNQLRSLKACKLPIELELKGIPYVLPTGEVGSLSELTSQQRMRLRLFIIREVVNIPTGTRTVTYRKKGKCLVPGGVCTEQSRGKCREMMPVNAKSSGDELGSMPVELVIERLEEVGYHVYR